MQGAPRLRHVRPFHGHRGNWRLLCSRHLDGRLNEKPVYFLKGYRQIKICTTWPFSQSPSFYGDTTHIPQNRPVLKDAVRS